MSSRQGRRIFPTRLAAVVGTAILAVALPAFAQDFLFSTNRIYRSEGARGPSGSERQFELYHYRNGSEVRLTHSLDRHEYEPVPSTDGRHVAFVATQALQPDAEESRGWSWRVGVISLLLGQEVAGWDLPNTLGMTAPASGFRPTWLAGGKSLLVQVPDPEGGWEVHRFDVGSPSSERVARGYGLTLSPDGTRVATTRNGVVYATSLADGQESPLTAGDPLAWHDQDQLFVATARGLELVNADTETRTLLFDYPGYYGELAVAPGGEHYALALLQDESWFLMLIDRNHALVEDYLMPGAIYDIGWLDSERVLFTIAPAERDFGIATIDLDGNDPYIVDSWADDIQGRPIRR